MPERTFAITSATPRISTDSSGGGQVSFTVTNTTARAMRCQALLRPLGGTKSDWLSIAGETERNFAPKETHQIAVNVAIPQDISTGVFQFRLDACSTQNPDDDYTEGPAVAVEVVRATPQPTPPPEKKFPWWIVLVLAGIVLAGGVAIFFILSGQKPPEGFFMVGDQPALERAVQKFQILGIGPLVSGEPTQRGQRTLFAVTANEPISQDELLDVFKAAKGKPMGKAGILLVNCSFVFDRRILQERTAAIRDLLRQSGAVSPSEAASMPVILDNDQEIKTKLNAL